MGEFVLLPENRAAHVAAVRFATEAAELVLYLHGPPGSGKTHLTQLAVQLFTQHRTTATAFVVGAADLGRQMQMPPAERLPRLQEVKDADLLVLDDVQHWPRANANDLSAILDFRQRKRRLTLATATVGPAQLDLPPRLTSRFTGGLTVVIPPLSLESRVQLAQSFCSERRLHVNSDVVVWLAQAPGGARPMLGEISRLETLAKLYPPPLTLSIVTAQLGETVSEPGSPVDRIARRVSERWRVSLTALKGKSRLANVVRARQVAMHVARRTGRSLTEIGRYFGRDHSTVSHGCDKIAEAILSDPVLASEVAELYAENATR